MKKHNGKKFNFFFICAIIFLQSIFILNLSAEESLLQGESNNLNHSSSSAISTNEDVPIEIDLKLGNAPLIIVSQPKHGLLVPKSDSANYIYSPFENYSGEDEFDYRVSDALHDVSNIMKIIIKPVNDPPIVQDIITTAADKKEVQITLAANDSDNESLVYEIVDQPKNGELIGVLPNIKYHPYKTFLGYDNFTYCAIDGEYRSGIALVSILPGNRTPEDMEAFRAGYDRQASLDILIMGPNRIREGEKWTLEVQAVSAAPILKFEMIDTDIQELKFQIVGQNNNRAIIEWDQSVARENAYSVTLSAKDGDVPEHSVTKQIQLFVIGNKESAEILPDFSGKTMLKSPSDLSNFQDYSGTSKNQTTNNFSNNSEIQNYYLPVIAGSNYQLGGSSNDEDEEQSRDDGGGSNTPPQVDAGQDQTLIWPNNKIALNGIVKDDGNPNPPAELNFLWSKKSGPGSVSFENAKMLQTTAVFSSVGTYTLTLFADDSAAQSSDDINITILSHKHIIHSIAQNGGSISPQGDVLVAEGDDQKFIVTPNDGFQVKDLIIDGKSQGALSGWIFYKVQEDHSIEAVFEQLENQNQPPVADAGDDQEYFLKIGESDVEIQLDGTRSYDKDGTIAAYVWEGSPDPDDYAKTNLRLVEGNYRFGLTAVDDKDLESDSDFVNVVIHPEPNAAPVIEEIAGVDVSQNVPDPIVLDQYKEGDSISFIVRAGDLNQKDVVNETLFPLPGKSVFQGSLGNPSVYQFDWIPEFSEAGIYALDLTASDSKESDYHQIELRVGEREPPTVFVNPPSPNQGHFNLEWNQVPGASQYQVQLSSDPNFEVDVDEKWTKNNLETYTIQNADTYYGRVQAWTRLPEEGGTATGFSDVVTVVVELTPKQYDLVVVNGTGSGTYQEGSRVLIAANIPTGHHFTQWTGDIEQVQDSQSSETEVAMYDNYIITANFSINQFKIGATAGSGGVISPSGDISVNYGADSSFVFNADQGYQIQNVNVDGTDQGAIPDFEFKNVISDHTIHVEFEKQNEPPTVNAGEDQEITLPTNQVNLIGLVTDDGLPSGKLTYLWSKISGPGTVTFGDMTQKDTAVSFSDAGEYILRLTADDSELQGFDEITITVNSGDPCNNPNTDEFYLLKESDGLEINISPDGKTFSVAWGGIVLRNVYSDEHFFEDRSGSALDIDYQITKADCGGVDISYHIINNSNQNQFLPNFQIDGFYQAEQGDLFYLNTKDSGTLERIDRSGTKKLFIDRDYPEVYSPVIVTTDDQASIGSSFIYPMLEYMHTISDIKLQRVTQGTQANTWRHWYEMSSSVAAGDSRDYKIAIRFAKPRYWLLTLAPYKEFFQSYYGSYRGKPADLRPMYKLNVSSSGADVTDDNPRRYNLNLKIHDPTVGWKGVVDLLIGLTGKAGVLNSLGYERVHIWKPSGSYEKKKNHMNFPPAFMDFLPYLKDSADQEFPRILSDGKELGFWWGRSDQVPVDLNGNVVYEWGAQNMVIPANYSNPEHVAFMTSQLELALSRGTKTIGLDNFVTMYPWDRYLWAKDLKTMAPNVTFIHEGSGADLFHSQIGNWYYPYRWKKITQAGPDVLSHYLNPKSEIWVQQDRDRDVPVTFEMVEQLVQWGFTPVLQRGLDIHNLNYLAPECFDGIDNDGDGFTDFPYDPQCLSARGASEKGIKEPACNNGIDDDGDGAIDYPDDISCKNAQDDDESPVQFLITNSISEDGLPDPDGSIAPNLFGKVFVEKGANQIFQITPSQNYSIKDVLVDGQSQGPVSSYEFQNVNENHEIYVDFIHN